MRGCYPSPAAQAPPHVSRRCSWRAHRGDVSIAGPRNRLATKESPATDQPGRAQRQRTSHAPTTWPR